MKRLTRKIAMFLVALFVCNTMFLAPMEVEAASKIVLKSGAEAPSTLYAGHSYTLKVDGVTCKFTSSNKKVATIGATTGKMKVLDAGTVKITAKNKKTGKTVATKTFTVYKRSTSIKLNEEEIYLNEGNTCQLKATLTPDNSTDCIRFYSSDKSVVTVGVITGKVIAIGNGTATITAYAKATKATSNSSKYNKIATVKVYVGSYLKSVEQTAEDEITLNFYTNMAGKDLSLQDFTVTNSDTKEKISFKSLRVETNVIKLILSQKLTNEKTYTVTYLDQNGKLVADPGKITSIETIPDTNVSEENAKVDPKTVLIDDRIVGIKITPYIAEDNEVFYPIIHLVDKNGGILKSYSVAKGEDIANLSLKQGTNYVGRAAVLLTESDPKAVYCATFKKYDSDGNYIGTLSTGDVTIWLSGQEPKSESTIGTIVVATEPSTPEPYVYDYSTITVKPVLSVNAIDTTVTGNETYADISQTVQIQKYVAYDNNNHSICDIALNEETTIGTSGKTCTVTGFTVNRIVDGVPESVTGDSIGDNIILCRKINTSSSVVEKLQAGTYQIAAVVSGTGIQVEESQLIVEDHESIQLINTGYQYHPDRDKSETLQTGLIEKAYSVTIGENSSNKAIKCNDTAKAELSTETNNYVNNDSSTPYTNMETGVPYLTYASINGQVDLFRDGSCLLPFNAFINADAADDDELFTIYREPNAVSITTSSNDGITVPSDSGNYALELTVTGTYANGDDCLRFYEEEFYVTDDMNYYVEEAISSVETGLNNEYIINIDLSKLDFRQNPKLKIKHANKSIEIPISLQSE